MTRKEYRKIAITKTNIHFVKSLGFPELLRNMALHLFLEGDLESEFSQETKRRLIELNTNGYTS
uniref:Uncharacterized protein n=1 Tax=viral metagenome TaxID=1070528 RepID=A0A6M3ILA8_9ZZZZ